MATALFGSDAVISVVDGSGRVETTASALNGKVLGIYFSAHWCPPCRMFTPKLNEWYKNFKANHAEKDRFELVFVSSDRDEASFKEYVAEMAFPALSYSDRKLKDKLSSKFKVSGIPTLVFVDETGQLLTKNGRSIVMSDADAANFPWKPKPFKEVIKGTLANNKGESVEAEEALAGKIVALQFSASWCGPCRAFTPQLIKMYNQLKEQGKQFEVIFVSGDRDQEAYDKYFEEMPWLALPFEDGRVSQLNHMYEVQGIPTVIILDESGKVITSEGRSAIGDDHDGSDFPWHPKPIVKLTESSISKLNDQPTFIHFVDDVDVALATLTPIAEAEAADAKASDRDAVLYMVAGDDEPAELVRQFANLGDEQPMNVLIDIPGQSKYKHSTGVCDTNVIQKIVTDFIAGSLDVKGIQS
jgi:nucleoredoxin